PPHDVTPSFPTRRSSDLAGLCCSTVVVEYFSSGGFQFRCELFCSFKNLIVFTSCNNMHVSRCYIHRPNQALIVVVCFSKGGDRTRYSDTVGPHGDYDLFAMFIQHL